MRAVTPLVAALAALSAGQVRADVPDLNFDREFPFAATFGAFTLAEGTECSVKFQEPPFALVCKLVLQIANNNADLNQGQDLNFEAHAGVIVSEDVASGDGQLDIDLVYGIKTPEIDFSPPDSLQNFLDFLNGIPGFSNLEIPKVPALELPPPEIGDIWDINLPLPSFQSGVCLVDNIPNLIPVGSLDPRFAALATSIEAIRQTADATGVDACVQLQSFEIEETGQGGSFGLFITLHVLDEDKMSDSLRGVFTNLRDNVLQMDKIVVEVNVGEELFKFLRRARGLPETPASPEEREEGLVAPDGRVFFGDKADKSAAQGGDNDDSGIGAAGIALAATGGVLAVAGVAAMVVVRRRRSAAASGGSKQDQFSAATPYTAPYASQQPPAAGFNPAMDI